MSVAVAEPVEIPTQPATVINPWIIAFTVMLATFMEVLDTSVANVALPHIAGNLAASVDETTWVLTSYLVSNAIVLPLGGWFSMLFGRKRFYMFCVALFTVSSCLCGLAPSLTLLVVFRTLQGVGGGALQPISQAILVESFPKHKQGMAMAVYGMGVVVAPIVGPTLGGWITDNYSWRWIFLINIPVGVLSLVLSSMLLADPPYLERRRLRTLRIDYIGIGLLALGLGFLEVMLDEGQRNDWFGSGLITAAAVIAIVALISVTIWEWRHEDPVVDLKLLKDRNFSIATASMFLLGFMLYGSTMLLPVFMQTLLGYTALLSGMALSPGAAMNIVFLPIVGKLISKVQARVLVMCGLGICAAGLFMMAGFNTQVDFPSLVQARLVQSVGLAFLFVPLNTIAFSYLPKQNVNRAAGLINLARNVGGSCGIAAVTTILARRAQVHQNILISHLTQYDFSYRTMMDRATQLMASKGASPVEAGHQAQALIYRMALRESTMMAFVDAFRVLAILFLCAIPLMLFVRRGHAKH